HNVAPRPTPTATFRAVRRSKRPTSLVCALQGCRDSWSGFGACQGRASQEEELHVSPGWVRGVSPGRIVLCFFQRASRVRLRGEATWHARCACCRAEDSHECCSKGSSPPRSWASAAPSSAPTRVLVARRPTPFTSGAGGAERAAGPRRARGVSPAGRGPER